MCGRVIQSSAPIRYGIVDGMNVRDSRVHNYPPRWNGAPSQDLLVIRRNHQTGEVRSTRSGGASFLIGVRTQGWAEADQRQMRDRSHSTDIPGGISPTALHPPGRWLLRVESHQGPESQAALCHRHEGWQPIRHWRAVGELEGPDFGRMDRTFAIITTDANELVAEIHDRMPLILPPPITSAGSSDEPDPRDLMRPFPAEPMRMWPISTRVNKPENDEPSIVQPIELTAETA